MRIWRVTLERKNGDGSGGYEYCATKRKALEFAESVADEHETTIDTINVRVSKQGMLNALNRHGGHPDNG